MYHRLQFHLRQNFRLQELTMLVLLIALAVILVLFCLTFVVVFTILSAIVWLLEEWL
ncbi:MAG: hypothetical protein AMXMBFR16_10960 [Candidatus Uhrbacteria bacterium]